MGIVDEYFEQYEKYRKQFGERMVIFMQVGSFYEVYGVKNEKEKIGCAEEIAELLNIQLTRKDKKILENSRENPLMCGIPCVALKKYQDILINNNYTIVLLDQTTKGKKIVRQLSEIIGPGTYLTDTVEKVQQVNNNIMSIIFINQDKKVNTGKTDRLTCSLIIGISIIDVTTGDSKVIETYCNNGQDSTGLEETYRCLLAHQPKELIINTKDIDEETLKFLTKYFEFAKYCSHIETKTKKEINEYCKIVYQNQLLKKIFNNTQGLTPIEYLDLETKLGGTTSFILLLQYVYEHNEQLLSRLKKPNVKWGDQSRHMIITYNALTQLNIISSNNGEILGNNRITEGGKITKDKKQFYSLFDVVNQTSTGPGKRLLYNRLVNPTTQVDKLNQRYDIISELNQFYNPKTSNVTDNDSKSKKIYEYLESYLVTISDLDKYHRRIALGMLSPIDFVSMNESYQQILELKKFIELLDLQKIPQFAKLIPSESIWNKFSEFINLYNELFDLNLMAQCVISFRKNAKDTNDMKSFIKPNVNKELDNIDSKIELSQKYLKGFCAKLNEYLVIQSLKNLSGKSDFVRVSHSDKEGYYLVVTRARGEILQDCKKSGFNKELLEQLPEKTQDFLLKQISEINITEQTQSYKITSPSIKKVSESLENHLDTMKRVTKEQYQKYLLEFYDKYGSIMLTISHWVSEIDFVKSLTKVSFMYGYCRPTIISHEHSFIKATKMRHPLIEHLTSTQYVANDLLIGSFPTNIEKDSINGILLYGSNSAGKSTYMKAIPCNQILAQLGCYVAAQSYIYSPFEKIMSRISGDDNIFQGSSSFVVEMRELRTMLKYSDSHTLCVGDEICRGTELPSAVSIVAAAIISLIKNQSNFIFTSHLHQIPTLPRIKNLSNVRSFHLTTTYDPLTESLIFDRIISPGPGNAIYGLEVAKGLDLGSDFISLAQSFRKEALSSIDPCYSSDLLSTKKSRYNSSLYVDSCSKCGSKSNLHTHHINEQHLSNAETKLISTESSVFHKDSSHNLVVLCDSCHSSLHNGKFSIKGYVNTSNGTLIE